MQILRSLNVATYYSNFMTAVASGGRPVSTLQEYTG